MTWELDDDRLAEHVARIDADGYTVLERAIEPELVASLREAIRRLERELDVQPRGTLAEGHSTRRMYNLLAKDPVFQAMPLHRNVLPIVERLLDRGCLLSGMTAIDIGPGERAQPIHPDDLVMTVPRPHPPLMCTSLWALTDFTDANGATRVIPGSHLRDHSPTYLQPYDSVPAEMAAGSVLVWHGSLWHGGGANQTERRRVGVAMNYCAGYVRQQENQQLGIPREIARGFAPRLRELVGYSVYNGLIGHIDKQSPLRLLDGVSGEGSMVWDVADR